ncbi:TonB-dependent receptor [Opitutus sp. ER46]|uniref:TonB-dependent receptor n=1 Tax=Opitutus sp. ER46 TaxID=2161864 RepID=UPI001E4BA622|nr:TonB-dependent receptor [Opitutus sp. ER46]
MALTLGAMLGRAQTAPAPTAATVNPPPSTAPTEPIVKLDEVVVSGMRTSLSAALDIKRESVQLVDSIVSEDIGKFPDNNLVEALQRMTGVQVTNRGAGEIATVSIRGLNDINTTLNGQNIFTASGTALALQDVPASLLSRVDVYKTRSADLIEAGIAGSMDIRTHRPFDFKGRKFVVAARGIYQEQADRTGSNLSAMYSDRWDTSAGKVGALVALAFVKTPYRDQNVTAGAMVPFVTDQAVTTGSVTWVPYERIFTTRDGIAENPIWQAGLEDGLPTAPGSTITMNGVKVPYVLSRDAVFQNDYTGTRERPAANVVLQWAPNKDSEYTFEGFYNGYRNDIFNNLFFSFVDWWGGPHGKVTLYPGTNIVKARERTPWVYGFTSGDLTKGKTDSYFYSVSGKWNVTPDLKLKSALTYQDSQYTTDFFAMRADHVHNAIAVDFNPGNGIPAYQFEDDPATAGINESNMADPRLWNIAQLYDNANKFKGDAYTWTADGDYKPQWSMLSAIKFGVRYDVREASEYQRTQSADALGVPLNSYPELWHFNHDFFDGHSDVPRSWVVPNGYAIFDNAEKWRQLYKAKFPAFKLGNELSLFENFNVEETTTAAYLRGDFKTFIADRKLDGQVGARYVNVKTDMDFTDQGTLTRGSASVTKGKLLPSGSLRYAITPNLMLRASYAETLRRPSFADLNPMINYVKDVTNVGYGTATGGNPNLKPTESKNYDVALEWYFGKASSIYATLFKRKIDGFVVSFRKRVTYQNYDYILTQPDNTSNGELKGYEVGLVYFPDNLPGLLNGLGVQASYTGLDSQQDIPITDSAGKVTGTLTRDLFGVSKSSYSAVLAYERKRFSTRLSYVWREAFLNNYEAALFANPLGVYRAPESSLDFQLTYRVMDNLVLTFDATNLTEEIYQSYYKNAYTNNFGSSLYSRTFALGARYSF